MRTKLVFFGGGNMAEAIFAGLVTNPNYQIEVIQRNAEKAQQLSNKYPSITVRQQLSEKLASDAILILAIKPQQAKDACASIQPLISDCLIISVMAGLTIATLQQWLNNPRLVRTMPNTPASIGKGITAVYATPAVTTIERQIVQEIFATVGLVYPTDNENIIDKITPISSSSIAFIYYFMEGLINNAVTNFGFKQEEATQLVREVLIGSAELLNANPEVSLSEQRARVTSKKGATEQGVLSFEQNQLHTIIGEAMAKCHARILEMAQEFN